ncbi:hypothetical protein O181_091605 [Austropuccinia psidii MF-1]|uniref:Uncharacterized protein n=1 Tax=Austropuccinia psidii MF-1 TaxID=1389203 RepID=A0A9Q3IY39_9BASI|nr:hypothetical protein [Austropuccinia psidii MF-1]
MRPHHPPDESPTRPPHLRPHHFLRFHTPTLTIFTLVYCPPDMPPTLPSHWLDPYAPAPPPHLCPHHSLHFRTPAAYHSYPARSALNISLQLSMKYVSHF